MTELHTALEVTMGLGEEANVVGRIAGSIQEFFAAINAHDIEGIRRACDPECVFRDPSAAEDYDLDGYLGVSAEYFRHFPDVRWDVLHLLVESDGVCVVYRCHGTGDGEWPAGVCIHGLPHDMVEVLVAQVRDARLCRLDFHIDLDQLSRQPWAQGAGDESAC